MVTTGVYGLDGRVLPATDCDTQTSACCSAYVSAAVSADPSTPGRTRGPMVSVCSCERFRARPLGRRAECRGRTTPSGWAVQRLAGRGGRTGAAGMVLTEASRQDVRWERPRHSCERPGRPPWRPHATREPLCPEHRPGREGRARPSAETPTAAGRNRLSQANNRSRRPGTTPRGMAPGPALADSARGAAAPLAVPAPASLALSRIQPSPTVQGAGRVTGGAWQVRGHRPPPRARCVRCFCRHDWNPGRAAMSVKSPTDGPRVRTWSTTR